MKPWEIIRIIIITIIGAVAMFWGQYSLYSTKIIFLGDVPVDRWLAADYTPAALIVFGVCVLSTVAWYFLAAVTPFAMGRDVSRWTLVWWLLGLLPLGSIGVSVFITNRSGDAQFSLIGLFVLDALLLYWLATATSSPEPVKYIPPGAFLIRHKLMGD
ncbi:MAG: hypothetical protein HC890_19525 [Chloroflexaceae bacterium]|nr:hypothetical protein [Chloroflexaceae bacterium]